MSHTTGSWIAKGEKVWNADEVMYVAAKNFNTINPSQTLKANARLIAAAPELLEALINFVVLYKQDQIVIEGDDGNDPVVTKALAAIAKATGDECFSQYYQPQKESDLD